MSYGAMESNMHEVTTTTWGPEGGNKVVFPYLNLNFSAQSSDPQGTVAPKASLWMLVTAALLVGGVVYFVARK